MQTANKFTFNWLGFAILVYILLKSSFGQGTGFQFYLMLAIVVLLHELGHTAMGLLFKCRIREVQLFFISVISYKMTDDPHAPAWKRIRWTLGALPFGGVTIFDNQNPTAGEYGLSTRPMWQQLLISGAGIMVNLLLFAILYVCEENLPLSNDAYATTVLLSRLSLILAILNLIPVYPLDGGAMLFQLIQLVTGEKLSQKFMTTMSYIGFAFIIVFFFIYTDWMDPLFSWILSNIAR